MLQLLAAQALAARAASAQTRVHGAPGPLAADAVTHDWTSFLGPSHNAVSTETHLSRTLPPPLLWELPKGTGYASPAIAGDRLVFVHRLGDAEVVECLHPETGSCFWQHRYATAFQDRYGYNNGPRSSPVIDGGRVYTVGAEGRSTVSISSRARSSGHATSAPSTACGRISSAPPRRRSSRAGCSWSTSARRAARAWRRSTS